MNQNNSIKLIRKGELSKKLGIREGTIRVYSNEGLLPYKVKLKKYLPDKRKAKLHRWYNKEQVKKRLVIINKLKKQGRTIAEIKERLKNR